MLLRHAFIPAHNTRLAHLCGPLDEHLRAIEAGLQVSIAHRHEHFKIDSPKKSAKRTLTVLQALYEMADQPLRPGDVQLMLAGDETALALDDDGAPVLNTRRAGLKARTPNQAAYLQNIASCDITFGIGPASTDERFQCIGQSGDGLRSDERTSG